ncbi:MAG: cytochrome c-type biogenesis protein [Gemmatimonas sp.]
MTLVAPHTRAARQRSVALLVAGLVTLGVAPLRAQTRADTSVVVQPAAAPLPGVDSVLDARVQRVSERLRCPVCQGESIQDSPAELSGQMRTLVREQLANGRSEQEVLDYFLQKYGQWILLEPRAEGINLLVYWLPVFFLLIGGVGLVIAVRRWTRPLSPVVATDASAPSESESTV